VGRRRSDSLVAKDLWPFFSETRHGSRILDNRCRSVNAAGHKRALLKR
jgi:hypothetical protein